MALDVIDISAEGLAAYVVPECRTGRPPADLTPRKEHEAARPEVRSGRRRFNGM
jgi:hypothetical protein